MTPATLQRHRLAALALAAVLSLGCASGEPAAPPPAAPPAPPLQAQDPPPPDDEAAALRALADAEARDAPAGNRPLEASDHRDGGACCDHHDHDHGAPSSGTTGGDW